MSPKFLLLVFHVCGKTSFYFFLCGKTFLQKDRKTSIFFLCEFFFFVRKHVCGKTSFYFFTCAERLLKTSMFTSSFSRVRNFYFYFFTQSKNLHGMTIFNIRAKWQYLFGILGDIKLFFTLTHSALL